MNSMNFYIVQFLHRFIQICNLVIIEREFLEPYVQLVSTVFKFSSIVNKTKFIAEPNT